jgi:hypothetical protein
MVARLTSFLPGGNDESRRRGEKPPNSRRRGDTTLHQIQDSAAIRRCKISLLGAALSSAVIAVKSFTDRGAGWGGRP